jgi:hypothetical protein
LEQGRKQIGLKTGKYDTYGIVGACPDRTGPHIRGIVHGRYSILDLLPEFDVHVCIPVKNPGNRRNRNPGKTGNINNSRLVHGAGFFFKDVPRPLASGNFIFSPTANP